MIDCENEVFTRISEVLEETYSDIDIASDYVSTPAAFPHVSITQSDCYTTTDKQDTSMSENMVTVVFEINVYSNKTSGKKAECKDIMNTIDSKMQYMNFRRTALTPVPNLEDATIYRLTARYSAATDGKNFYRR